MSSSTFTAKYNTAAKSDVAQQFPYKKRATFSNISNWSIVDKLNDIKTVKFQIPNQPEERINVVLERNISIPFLTPFKGVITSKSLGRDKISVVAKENAWHLTRRIFRAGSLVNHNSDSYKLEMQGGSAAYVDGKFAKAFNFTGSNEIQCNAADEGAFDFENNAAFSMGGWIKSSNIGSQQYLYQKLNGVVGISIYFSSSNHLCVSLCNTANSNELKKRYTTNLLDGEWHHIWITKSTSLSASGLKLYVDGVEVSTTTDADTLSASILNNNVFTLGGKAGSYRFTGHMDEWRIYNVEHNSTKAKQVMDNTESLSGVVARYPFNSAKLSYTSTAVNVLAQSILDKANEDMPSGMTWELGPNTSTEVVDIEFKFRNHWEALQKLAQAAKLDLWADSENHIIYLEAFRSKGKMLDKVLDIVVESTPHLSVDQVANQINVLGKEVGTDTQLESIAQAETDLKYTYEMVVSDRQITSMAAATGAAEKLLDEYKILTPVVKAKVPFQQYVRFDMETGDVIRIVKPEQELDGKFRILELAIQSDSVALTLESNDTAVSHVRSRSMGDILGHLLRKMNDNNIN
tara:strand:+ start:24573 stop:26297 length:1725 start_codon:yes stop_codon:yes gene_type:complete